MVSRSIEKMLLIAIGLSTVVIVGVPVLLYSIQTINNISEVEMAQSVAQRILNKTDSVDRGEVSETSIQVEILDGFHIEASSKTLTIRFVHDDTSHEWTREYNHTISLTPPGDAGTYMISIEMRNSTIVIECVKQ